jgi:putative FmdB family regulatory protein
MPFLQYKCNKCNKEFEELVKNTDIEVKCPYCNEIATRSYNGKIYSATGKPTKKCNGNCKTCGGCK